jgi:hypothetical protein
MKAGTAPVERRSKPMTKRVFIILTVLLLAVLVLLPFFGPPLFESGDPPPTLPLNENAAR